MLINHRIEDATALLNEALGILPKSTVLLECKNNINAFKPVQLTEDFIVDAYAYWYEMEVKLSLEDKLRNNYAFGYQFGGNWSEKAYLTFLLKGEYEHFSAIVAPYSGWADGEDNSYAQLCVYCDNTLISTTKINRTTEPINIDVNTTGIKELKLEIIYDNGGGLIIAEPFIYAKY